MAPKRKAVAEPVVEDAAAAEEPAAGPRRSGRGHPAPVEKPPAASKAKKSKKEEPVDDAEEEQPAQEPAEEPQAEPSEAKASTSEATSSKPTADVLKIGDTVDGSITLKNQDVGLPCGRGGDALTERIG
jgi:hypothetical protein